MKTWVIIIAGVVTGSILALLVAHQQGRDSGTLMAAAAGGGGAQVAPAPAPVVPRNPAIDPAILAKMRAKLAPGAAAAQPAATGPANGKDRVPHPPLKPGEIPDMAIKELANFLYDPAVGGVPADVLAYDGHVVRLRGFMLPLTQADTITRFALVPSLFSCCFGQPPGVEHTIGVTCQEGKAVQLVPDEVVVQGVLHVKEQREEGFTYSIFEMTATSVKLAPQ